MQAPSTLPAEPLSDVVVEEQVQRGGSIPGLDRLLAYAAVALCCAFTFWVGRPDAALAPCAPARSDLGAHITALQHLVEFSLPHGNVMDWSHQWFSGYPSFYFYFPLPALMIAALSLLAPLAVAAKLVAIIAPAMLPAATYSLVRSLGFGRLHAACAAVSMVAYLTMTYQYIFGGNVLSSVIGEYSFAVGLLFAVLYLGYVARAMRGERRTVALTLLLAASALCHSIPTFFAVIASCVTLRDPFARRQVATSWLAGFALTAFWSVPFVLRSPFMGPIEWTHVVRPKYLFPYVVVLLLPCLIAALVVLRPFRRELSVLAAFSLSAALFYLVPQHFFAPARTWPIWHFGFFTVVGIGIGEGLRRGWQHQRRMPITLWAAALVLVVGAVIMQMDLVRRRAGELFASDAPDAAAFDSLRTVLAALPPGQLHWEQLPESVELLGGNLSLTRLPSIVPGMRTAVGLLRESGYLSPVTSYIVSNISWDTISTGGLWNLVTPDDDDPQGMRTRLRRFGIDYFVSVTDEGRQWAEADTVLFEKLADGEPWSLFRNRQARLVEPLRRTPAVVTDGDWNDQVARWIEDVPDTAGWKIFDAKGVLDVEGIRGAADGAVEHAELGYNSVRFRTSAIGAPHLVRVAYFPNWRAHGADGPYVAVPGFMIVVPRQADVLLRFERTPIDHAGRILTLLGTVILLWIWLRERRTAPHLH